MTLRIKLRSMEQSVRDNERFYLVVWVEEDNVSIHSEKELKEQPGKCAVGSTCSVKFGRRSAARWYTGKIASVGTKVDMIEKEKAYLKGEFTPFEESTQSDGMKNGDVSERENETVSENANDEPEIYIVDQPMQGTVTSLKKRKRKLITDKSKTSCKVEGSKGQEKEQSTNENKKKGVAWCSESGNETEIEITDEAESDNTKQGASSKKKKRKLITDKSKKSGKMITDKSKKSDKVITDKSKKSDKVITDKSKKGSKKGGKVKDNKGTKKQKPSNGKKKKGGGILAYGSGGESGNETDDEANSHSSNPEKITNSDDSVGVATNSANSEKITDKSVGDNDRNVGMSSDGNADNPGSTNDESAHDIEGIYEGMIGGEYPEYHSEDSLLSSEDEVPKGRKDDILKKLTLCMGNIEKQNRAMLSRVESLESNQYSQGYMMLPPWLMGQHHYMVPPANNLSQSFGGNSLSSPLQVSSPSHSQFSSPLSTRSDSSGNFTAPPTTPNKATLITTISTKENSALPPINHNSLISPQAVVDKHPKMLRQSQIPKLSIRLAQEAYFGKEVMSFCTFRGVGSYHALPEKEVTKLKEFLKKLTIPGIVSTRPDFEILWKKCVESIGQSCKTLRKLRLANLKLE